MYMLNEIILLSASRYMKNRYNNDVCDVIYSECMFTPGKLEKYAWPRWQSNLRPLEYSPDLHNTNTESQI